MSRNLCRLSALLGALLSLVGFYGPWIEVTAFGRSAVYSGWDIVENGAFFPCAALAGGFIGLISASLLLFKSKGFLKYSLLLAGFLVLLGGSTAVASIELEGALEIRGLGIFVGWGHGSLILPIGGVLLVLAGLGTEKIIAY